MRVIRREFGGDGGVRVGRGERGEEGGKKGGEEREFQSEVAQKVS